MTENEQKADLIKNGLIIVDELAKLEIGDNNDIIDLIERAQKLKKDRFFVLK